MDLCECDAAVQSAGAGYCAAVPVAAHADGAAAVLLLGGARDATGHVRPRTLAALDAVARRIEQPIVASLAHARLARLDADVLRLDRLVALGTLVAEVVHEVRNPLVSVKTFLQLLPERRGDPEFLQSFLDVAGDELQRIERLLDLLLDHASARMPAPGSGSGAAAADVAGAVEKLVAHRAAAAGVRIESDVAAALPLCAIEPDALRQVLLNLVLNALEVTPAGGDVRVAARCDRPRAADRRRGPWTRHSARAAAPRLRAVLLDQGGTVRRTRARDLAAPRRSGRRHARDRRSAGRRHALQDATPDHACAHCVTARPISPSPAPKK